jgi:3-dehydroquinate dehydratase-2|tara:strand:- start:68 stop:517 length:450 start_codon:yes stop_codon:yes gene_type:complete
MKEKNLTVLLVNGPNLNLLGERSPEIYGTTSLSVIESNVAKEAEKRGVTVKSFQSNHEGKLIDFLHENRKLAIGVLINPGGLTHTSVVLRDAIESIGIPVIEVHLSDIYTRENFRRLSLIADVCIDQVTGLGPEGYIKAINLLLDSVEG